MLKQPSPTQLEDAYLRRALRDIHESLSLVSNRYIYWESGNKMGHPSCATLLGMLERFKREVREWHRATDSTADRWLDQHRDS
jgi:hypothetical protein